MNWGKQYKYKKSERKVTKWRLGVNTKLQMTICAQTMRPSHLPNFMHSTWSLNIKYYLGCIQLTIYSGIGLHSELFQIVCLKNIILFP